MLRNDEKLRGLSHKNKGAYRRQGASRDGEFMLQYLKSIL
jgi:hypothetical protein